MNGQATTYDVRYSTSPINDGELGERDSVRASPRRGPPDKARASR